MLPSKNFSFIHRFVRSLLPSPISALLCALFGTVIVGAYLLLYSLSVGTSLPELFDGEWSVAYTNNVVQPLLSILSNLTIGKIFILLLWGLVGFIVYLIVEYGTHFYRNWRMASHDIQITDRAIVAHPGLSPFIAAAIWRLSVLIIFSIVIAFALQPLLEELAALTPKAVLGQASAASILPDLLLLAGKLAILAHALVTFCRLFAMRVRLFGGDPY